MDISTLTRDAAAVKKSLKSVPGGKVIALKEARIHVPSRYLDKELAFIGEDVYILGVYALLVDKVYAVSKTLGMVKITPSETNRIMINDVEYLEFVFMAGSTVFDELDIVIKNTLVFNIYDVFVDSGLTPWFIGYEDKLTLFHRTPIDNNVKIGANRAILEMIVATTARYDKDRTQYYRQILGKDTKGPAWVPFKSIVFGPKTTVAKLSGAYFDQGLVSALTHPTERPEKIEQLLRQ